MLEKFVIKKIVFQESSLEDNAEGIQTQQLVVPQTPEQDPVMLVAEKKPDPAEDFWNRLHRAETSQIQILPVELQDTNLTNTETHEDNDKAKNSKKKIKKTRKVRDAKNSDKVVEKENESKEKLGKKFLCPRKFPSSNYFILLRRCKSNWKRCSETTCACRHSANQKASLQSITISPSKRKSKTHRN